MECVTSSRLQSSAELTQTFWLWKLLSNIAPGHFFQTSHSWGPSGNTTQHKGLIQLVIEGTVSYPTPTACQDRALNPCSASPCSTTPSLHKACIVCVFEHIREGEGKQEGDCLYTLKWCYWSQGCFLGISVVKVVIRYYSGTKATGNEIELRKRSCAFRGWYTVCDTSPSGYWVVPDFFSTCPFRDSGEHPHRMQLRRFLLYCAGCNFYEQQKPNQQASLRFENVMRLNNWFALTGLQWVLPLVVFGGSYWLLQHVTAANRSNGARELPHDFNDNYNNSGQIKSFSWFVLGSKSLSSDKLTWHIGFSYGTYKLGASSQQDGCRPCCIQTLS